MKTVKSLGLVSAALLCGVLVAACGDLRWHAAQLPGVRGVSDRMGDRALQRRFAGDPLQELDQNTAGGDYQFRGLAEWGPSRHWVPGIPSMREPSSQVEYLTTDPQASWTASAEAYFARYNKVLLVRRHGKKLDGYGRLSQ